ncbi:aminoglycoside phosphotransferase family protein [Actinoplanes sp. NBRC 103695]|uniref:phosphotransferase n=1 Tax=Actinoplanes sp. NBRC 103695 TaxID=3032202 RepID=UPI0024A00478|nr:aminoglycoside phosphotransferase family protein [Actinoplanes sp. NBRC 103695]GLY99814.1 trifolitoxin immunity domain-containing protein [Actinoplanes sp. NBRC 103695]
MSDDVLPGGRFAAPIRDGDTVTRRRGLASTNVAALLDHLAARGFAHAPRMLGSTPGGRDVLTYLPGEAAHPPLPAAARSDRALRSAGRFVRALHDATEGFVAPEPGQWVPHDLVTPVAVDCVGHGDLNPGNLLFQHDQIVGVIDFDTAGPSNRVFDLALLAHHLVPLHHTDALPGFGWDHEPDRGRRLSILATAYGDGMQPSQLVDYAALRLLSMAGHIQSQLDGGNPAYAGHAGEPDGYRQAAVFILTHRHQWLRRPPR